MSDTSSTQFKQSLGLLDATMLVSGAMIGSGIFIVSADMARMLGSTGWLLVAWLLTGVVTVAAALSYGELAGMMPKAGGQYIYIQRSFGPLTSFVYGWTVFTVIQTGTIAAVAVAFTKYSAVFLPKLNLQDANNVLVSLGPVNVYWGTLYAIACIILLTYVNTRGGGRNAAQVARPASPPAGMGRGTGGQAGVVSRASTRPSEGCQA